LRLLIFAALSLSSQPASPSRCFCGKTYTSSLGKLTPFCWEAPVLLSPLRRRQGLHSKHAIRRHSLSGVRPGAWEILFFDGPAGAAQMLPEGVGRVSGAPGQVVIESGLLAQCPALTDPAGLVPLGFPDLVRGDQ
jgi:hypothetical protein